jgi:hypothetical protein
MIFLQMGILQLNKFLDMGMLCFNEVLQMGILQLKKELHMVIQQCNAAPAHSTVLACESGA